MHRKSYNALPIRLKNILCGILLAVLVVGIFPVQTYAAASQQRKTVRVGYYIAPNFQEYDENTDTYSGSGYEYLIALQQYTNWDYEFVPVNFGDGVKMLEEGQIDLMNNVSKTTEREHKLSFSSYASGANYGCLIVAVDNPNYAYNDFESFQTMRVGMLRNSIFRSYFEAYCKEHDMYPQVNYYEDENGMNAAFADGKIDARVVSSSYQDGSRVVARFAPMSYYFAMPKSETTLLNELNNAMVAVETDMPNYAATLQERYDERVVEQTVVLSASEKKYVASHPTVTVAVSGAWYPLFYYDKTGTLAGPLADIYHMIEQATGLTFQPVRYDTYDESLEAVKNGDVDMIVECAYDFVYASQWNIQLSDKVNGIEIYRIINEKNTSDTIHKIAFYGEPYLESQVRKRYGDTVEYIDYANVEAAANAVLSGEADCTFVNYYTSTKFQNKGKYLSLKYILIPSLKYNFGIGMNHNTDPRLKSLIGKGLHTIDDDTMENLFLNSALVETKPDIQAMVYQHPAMFLIFFCMIVGAILVIAYLLFTKKRNVKAFVHEQTYRKELEEALEQAQFASTSKTEFFARMSHDMRTPMNGILGLTALSQDETDVKTLKSNLTKIDESGKYLLGIINDTLDLQRIESGKLTLDYEIVDCRKTIETAIEMVRPGIAAKKIDFEIVNKGVVMDCDIRIDPVRIKQIFVNLISNAIKFTPEGGKIAFEFECLGREGMIAHDRFTIRDTGVGMSEGFIRERLFQPFAQEQNALSGQYAGSGLGLSIVKRLVALMGGTIEVESELGTGSAFIICMDIERVDRTTAERSALDESKKQKNAIVMLHGCKILLVEDHPLNAEIARKLLEKAGCIVTWAKDGSESVALMKQFVPGQFDVILMDLRMPVMDGLTAAAEIRKLDDAAAKHIPIIAMTANAYSDDVAHCKAVGMNAHIAKPVQPAVLYQTIVAYLPNGMQEASENKQQNRSK